MYATSLKKLKKVLAFDEKLCYDYQHTAGNAVLHKENLTTEDYICHSNLMIAYSFNDCYRQSV